MAAEAAVSARRPFRRHLSDFRRHRNSSDTIAGSRPCHVHKKRSHLRYSIRCNSIWQYHWRKPCTGSRRRYLLRGSRSDVVVRESGTMAELGGKSTGENSDGSTRIVTHLLE